MNASAPGGLADDTDLVTLRLAHRAMLRDVRRLARLTDDLAAGRGSFGSRRILAFGDWAERVCEEIRHHHEAEEVLLWPLVSRHAPEAVDLSGLRDDHSALLGLLGEVRRGARGVVAALTRRPLALATTEDHARMRRLAVLLTELAELLDEHVTESRRELSELIVRAVPRAQWQRAETLVREGRPDPVFTEIRTLDVADPEEVTSLRVGTLNRLSLRLSGTSLRRRERLLFGED